MKKIIFSICLAALAVGCTKTEVNYGATDQIAFAPVAYNPTKAALNVNAVPTCPLIVSAFAGEGADQAAYSQAYFKNVEFTDSNSDGIFEAAGYFWPNVKKLTFAGITKSAGLTTGSSVSIYDASNPIEADRSSFKVYNYSQPAVGSDNNDFMWFDRTAPASKPTSTSYVAESVTMMHACSWIVLNFNGDQTASNVNRPWNITKVTINNLAATGDVVLTSTATWPISGLGEKNKTLVVYNVQNGTDLKQVFTPSTNGIIVIPQKPTTVSVTYNYLSQGANTADTTDDIEIEETATVSLAYDGDASWLPGTKYTYNIKLTATGIKIAPKASSWVDYDADGDNTNGNQSIPGTI